jgi:hypothetical protein
VIPWDRRVLNAIKFLTGVRFGEAAGLRFRDLDRAAAPLMRLAIARSYDKATKTEIPRLVPVHPVLARCSASGSAPASGACSAATPLPDDLIVPSRRMRIRSRHQHRNKFLEDLELLGLRARRVHDTRRTFITLARVDGAPRDVLQHITHAPKRNIIDLYTTLPWPMLCAAVSCLRVRQHERCGTCEGSIQLLRLCAFCDAWNKAEGVAWNRKQFDNGDDGRGRRRGAHEHRRARSGARRARCATR